jgi:hypothetical protein
LIVVGAGAASNVKGVSDVVGGRLVTRLVNSLPTPISPIAGIVIAGRLAMIDTIPSIILNNGVDEFIGDLLSEMYLNFRPGEIITGGSLNGLTRVTGRGLIMAIPINGPVDVSRVDRIGEIFRPAIRDLVVIDVGKPIVISGEVDVSKGFHFEIGRWTHL